MKAILKSDRKVIIDVELHVRWHYLAEHRTECSYRDKEGNIYSDEEIEILEYQGG